MPRVFPAKKWLTILTLLYGGLLLYASLMPYDFAAGASLQQLWRSGWNHWPFNTRARLSGSDFLSNLVLYIPLGFLLAARCRIGGLGRFSSLTCAVLACSSLSFVVELLQGLTISRTISATDWALNSLSGLLGAVAGTLHGAGLWSRAVVWIERRWRTRPLDIITLVFMGLLSADSLAPFLPTILLSQVWRGIKRSQFHLQEGFAQHPWHWWLVTRLLVWAALTFLLAAWSNGNKREQKWRNAVLFALLFAFGLEIAKLLIVSRSFNITNVAVAALGIALTSLVGPDLANRLSRRRKLTLSILALTLYGLYLAWTPFNFAWDPVHLKQKLPTPIQLLPFYHYAMGAELNHARLFVQNIALSSGLIFLLRLRCDWLEENRFRLLLAMTIAVMAGLIQEGGQLFLPTRTPAMTDIYCYVIGGVLGASLNWYQRFSAADPIQLTEQGL